MYHQNSIDNIHFLHANKMAETLMRLQQHQQQDQDYAMSSPPIGNDRHAADPEGHHRYEQHQSPAVLNYASSSQQTQGTISSSDASEVPADCGGSSQSLFVVIPRIEYDFMKQELAGLRHTLNELKNTVSFEIHQLKVDGKALKQRVDACLCSSNVHHNKDLCSCQKSSSWNSEGGQQHATTMCSPVASSPDLTCMDKPAIHGFRSYGGASCSGFPMLSSNIFGTPGAGAVNSDLERNKLVQLLSNYDVWVNKLNLQITVNEAPSRKAGAALYLLRRIIPLVFSWDELACSRGQGLNCKTTDDVFGRSPLDPTKVMACKAFMRKFCADTGSPEPTERSVNQTFSHQVNYARRRIKLASQPSYAAHRPKKLHRSSTPLHGHMDSGIDSTSRNDQLQMPKTERYMQI